MKIAVAMLLTLLFTSLNGYGEMIQVVYFTPSDVSEPSDRDVEEKQSIMTDTQNFFGTQMLSHGYGYKTFDLQTRNGEVVIHKVRGDLQLSRYLNNVDLIPDEVSRKIRNDSDIKRATTVIFVSGADKIGNGALHIGECSKLCTDYLLVPAESRIAIHLTAHEIGHSFGLQHNPGAETFLMHKKIDINSNLDLNWKKISCNEAEWLSYNRYFSRNLLFQSFPRILSNYSISIVDEPGLEFVHFNVSVDSDFEIGVAQLGRNLDSQIISWSKESDSTAAIDFYMKKDAIFDIKDFKLNMIDIQGNRAISVFSIPDEMLAALDAVNENLDYSQLTLESEDDKSLNAINNNREWDGWTAGIWEKTPEGIIPPKPNDYLNFEYMDEWDHWIYTHASSRMVWNLDQGNYSEFDFKFYLPNPCGSTADVLLTILADGVEIYKSATLKQHNAQNKYISTKIPLGTRTLELQVDELDRDWCDHFVIGNARVYYDDSAAPSIHGKPKKKIGLWAGLKK